MRSERRTLRIAARCYHSVAKQIRTGSRGSSRFDLAFGLELFRTCYHILDAHGNGAMRGSTLVAIASEQFGTHIKRWLAFVTLGGRDEICGKELSFLED
jgi:hypothetical protein